jgi:hypothetical protein
LFTTSTTGPSSQEITEPISMAVASTTQGSKGNVVSTEEGGKRSKY